MEEIKDLQGNVLQVGDEIVVAERTYSKTPYLITGKIISIKPIYNKDGSWNSTDIRYQPHVSSDVYLSQLEDEDYNHCRYNLPKVFTIGKKNYVSILKIS